MKSIEKWTEAKDCLFVFQTFACFPLHKEFLLLLTFYFFINNSSTVLIHLNGWGAWLIQFKHLVMTLVSRLTGPGTCRSSRYVSGSRHHVADGRLSKATVRENQTRTKLKLKATKIGVALLLATVTNLITGCVTTSTVTTKAVDSKCIEYLYSTWPTEFEFPKDRSEANALLWNSFERERDELTDSFGRLPHHVQAERVHTLWKAIDELKGTHQPSLGRKQAIKALRKAGLADSAIGIAEALLWDYEKHFEGALKKGYGSY